jgi:hypothetical protein
LSSPSTARVLAPRSLASGVVAATVPVVLAALAAVRRPRRVPYAELALVATTLLPLAFAGRADVYTVLQLAFLATLGSQAPVRVDAVARDRVVAGLTLGLWGCAVLSLAQIAAPAAGLDGLMEGTSGRVASVLGRPGVAVDGRAVGFSHDPNSWAAAVLVPVTVATLGTPSIWRKLAAMVPAAMVAASSGSRSAGLALLCVALFNVLDSRTGRAAVPWLLATVLLAAATVLAVPSWRARLLGPGPAAPLTSANLLEASEAMDDPVWWSPRVDVTRSGEGPAGGAAWLLERTGDARTDRVQQRVQLERGRAYTFAFDYRAGEAPAAIGWNVGPEGPYGFDTTPLPDGTWSVATAGGVIVEEVTAAPIGEGWLRAAVTFSLPPGEGHRPLELGISPGTHARATVARPQLSEGTVAYVPTAAPDRTGLRARSAVTSRLEVYRAAVPMAIRALPLGLGPDGFEAVRSASTSGVIAAVEHEHSLPLWAVLRYGLLGLVSFTAYLWSVARLGRVHLGAVLVVLVANLFDLTFFSAGVFYPLALLANSRWEA